MAKAAYRTALIAMGLAVTICALLLLTGKRVLVWETRVEPGGYYVVRKYGNLGAADNAKLVCRYFTGRSVLTTVYWHSPNNFMGKDQCPFAVDERE
ncbi:hypothetical protein [Massilia glaciei]|uniref:hypothetical protein n=1 Tax=Massilia glaciei TaxID=1524097 RepID=UPI0011B29CB0|nr:hypothetical protein [Massilia glaciei]